MLNLLQSKRGYETILIAEDEEDVRAELADYLSDYEHCFAVTAREAVQKTWECTPDVVLLDLHFRDCRDFSLCCKIRESAPDAQVILVSELKDAAVWREVINSGAFDFVPKPIVRDVLRNRVRKALEIRDLQRSTWLESIT